MPRAQTKLLITLTMTDQAVIFITNLLWVMIEELK